jgi:protein TonB
MNMGIRQIEPDDENGSSPRWGLARPPRDLRRFLMIGVCVSTLFATGVYWLRQLPTGPTARAQGSVVHVQLVRLPNPVPSPQEPVLARDPPSMDRVPAPAIKEPEHPAVNKDRPLRPEMALARVAAAPAIDHEPPPLSLQTLAATSGGVLSFHEILLRHVERYRRYPETARKGHLEGVVQLLFAMSRDGNVLDVRVKASSGHPALDKEAVDTLRRAQPLPPIPATMPDRLNIVLPVGFSLH